MIGLETIFEFDDPAERLEGLLPRIEPEVARILERAVAGYEIGETPPQARDSYAGSSRTIP